MTAHTTTRTPTTCHHDHTLGHRITTDGEPCTEPHCTDCRRHHTPVGHHVCPECTGSVRTALEDIRWNSRHLRWHASRGEGLAIPSARIPGGDAMTVMARAGAGYDDLRTSFATPKHGNPHGARVDLLAEDHHPDDVTPVLLTLTGWEHQWRTHLNHTPRPRADRAPITAITRYLIDHLTDMARSTTGPDWLGFADDIRGLARQLEGVLHDEQAPQTGVPCFECGQRLVRRWGKPQPCRHPNPGRDHLAQVKRHARAAQARLDVIRTYPELGDPTYADLRAARRTPTSAEETAARQPCAACTASRAGQGGIEDPSVGQSWECLGCRKTYTPGEYGNAVRSHLLTSGPDRDGWTHVQMAAEAASTQTGMPIAAGTVRKWMDRTQVRSVCRWAAGERSGLRLVFWPDVADRAAEMVLRAAEVERERAERAAQSRRLYDAAKAKGLLDDRAGVLELGKSMGLHHSRVAAFLDEWDAAAEGAGREAS